MGVIPAPGQDIHDIIEGVATDLFDVSQGTVVTASSAQASYSNTGTSDPRSALGYRSSFIEPTRTIFSDFAPIATDFIDFQTSQPIDLGSYRIFLGSSEPGRWANGIRLYASSSSGDVQSHLVSSAAILGPYVPTYGSGALMISESLNLANLQFFRMEIDRATTSGFSGPRVIEIDAFPITNSFACPPPVILNFDGTGGGAINDVNGLGTGFTHRLPGTGSAHPTNDPNIDLVSVPGKLRLTSTHADINQSPGPTGNNLPMLEAPGVYLPGIGSKDVVVKATFENVSVPNGSDQLTLYAGVNENKVLRAGIHQTNVYIMSPNNGTGDMNTFTGPNAFATGDDIEVTLSRQSGLWSLSWHNLTSMTSGSLPGVSLPWLDAEPNLYFGVLAANAGTTQTFTAQIDDFSVTCIPEPSSLALIALAGLATWRSKGVPGGIESASLPRRR